MSNKILILGGGFAGLEAAIKMRKKKYDVTLVSDRPYFFIYPISIWIPTHKKSFEDVQIDLKVLAKKHGFNLVLDKAVGLNTENNEVQLENSKLNYDYLIIALGMHKVKTPGMEHTLTICGKPEESLSIRDRLDKLVEQGSGRIAIGFGGNPKDPTATAVRGGPAFELLFNFSHYLKQKSLRDKFEITFFAPMKEPGKRMGEKPYKKMDVFFKHYKINTRLGKKIDHFDHDAVVFGDDSRLESDLTIFIAAGSGHSFIENSNLPTSEAGFVRINELCRVQSHRNIYAIGDIAAIAGPNWAAKQGHLAEVMADTAAFNIHNEIRSVGKRKSYWEHLNIVCVMDSGDGAAFIKRTKNTEFIIPLPIIGHWMKKGWGWYFKHSKLKNIPRIPGM
ncbi:MAG: FAD-dependent oxidoreductase [Bacteroidales bacterium]|nr:FAD-dependent oxidoreductase [Bacteroidales bacterium]